MEQKVEANRKKKIQTKIKGIVVRRRRKTAKSILSPHLSPEGAMSLEGSTYHNYIWVEMGEISKLQLPDLS
jgi:hypothetical protein